MLTDTKYYLPLLKEKFPYLSDLDIMRIVNYGWRQFYFYNLRGCDTLLESLKYKFWMYCGHLTKNSLEHFHYYIKMLKRKFRAMFSKRKCEWNTIYYFGINNEEYEYLTKKQRGPKRKKFTFKKKVIYKLLDEAKVSYCQSKAIISVDMNTVLGYAYYKEELICLNPRIEEVRTHTHTFKDIMVSNNNYDLI